MNFASIIAQNESSAWLLDSIWRPFRAHRSGWPVPGLKPWAEFCSPFGAGLSG